ncbi:MAG: DNA-binding response regulator [bacterium]|nr:MAG: DNA-binding response regulator [bacterium]
MSDTLKILIVDDHAVFRKGLRDILNANDNLKVVGEAPDGFEALKLIKNLKPDIVILDISMPGMSGIEVLKKARKAKLETHFVILTAYNEKEYFNEAVDLGVKGYIQKDDAVDDIMLAIKAISADKYYFSPHFARYLIERRNIRKEEPSLSKLSDKERQIMKLVAENKTSQEVAKELGISFRTVQNHRANIGNKLDIKGSNKLLEFALKNKNIL